MDKEGRRQLKAVADEIDEWTTRHRKMRDKRRSVFDASKSARASLEHRIQAASQRPGGSPAWRWLPLSSNDARAITLMARAMAFPRLSEEVSKLLDELEGRRIQGALDDAKSIYGGRRLFARKEQKEAAARGADLLQGIRDRLLAVGGRDELSRVEARDIETMPEYAAHSLLDPAVGFAQAIGPGAVLIPRNEFELASSALVEIYRAIDQEQEFKAAVVQAGDTIRQAEARKIVREMPTERLKEATSGQIRLASLIAAGITTVEQVLDLGGQITLLPGVGETTGTRMLAAALTIWQTTIDEMPVRIDVKARSKDTTELLRTLAAWDAAREVRDATSVLAAAQILRPVLSSLDSKTTHLLLIPEAQGASDFREACSVVVGSAAALRPRRTAKATDPWPDFLARPADYFAMLSELGLLVEDEAAQTGDLPAEILEAIRALTLNTEHLKASLRGYQSFGARFALVQRKVVIGDEMGLGKTVESLAVLAHLQSRGSHHFLVVCPAAVVTNWVREVREKSDLRPYRLHGQGRDQALTSWARNGGVAVTTYDSLAWLEDKIPSSTRPSCLIFDEAHYIKNPHALRSERSVRLIKRSPRTILLTGTPLENRIEEFRNLVGYLRPDLTVTATEFSPRQFRKQVAPAYLRRNQSEVLSELPELVEVDEWMPLSRDDELHYAHAVIDGNFMAMRQAAFKAGPNSSKMQRLADLVMEAKANDKRVLVFSHFRHVLDDVAAMLPGHVFGPLTGSVHAAKRQQMVDDFSSSPGGAVLVAQIVAGGVGLNIQAASVVVICEPQLKPTTEWQAIARARRMGQLDAVQVHRLLSEEGVDVRVTEILKVKRELFDEFARTSATAESAPEAFDISDADIAREIVALERERLHVKSSAPAS
ncbi:MULTISPECIES: DEAD/DEAH box helicase [unclassified Aeromicrobium]|uniref:DEAD/DEAH box helicase n=1 Tax=unclassified Aeromicrobium TaxID=2633570 RepID=UPI00288BB2C5|nr:MULTISPECIES: DEAD/DEAH box helicase [unclassified Aeromicrobium]